MRYSLHDGPGIRTTVFFKGCPLHCWWCHNPECQAPCLERAWQPERCQLCERCITACSHQALRLLDGTIQHDPTCCQECGACIKACLTGAWSWMGRHVTADGVIQEVIKDRLFYDESGGGVTFSGGEPLMQPGFLEALLRLSEEEDLHAVVDTSGFAPLSVLARIAPRVNLFLFDLKVIDDNKHREYTGVSNAPILANLRWLLEQQYAVLVSLPVIPGLNDNETDWDQMGRFLAGLNSSFGVRLLPYHAIGEGKYQRIGRNYRLVSIATPSPERLKDLARQLGTHGIDARVGDG